MDWETVAGWITTGKKSPPGKYLRIRPINKGAFTWVIGHKLWTIINFFPAVKVLKWLVLLLLHLKWFSTRCLAVLYQFFDKIVIPQACVTDSITVYFLFFSFCKIWKKGEDYLTIRICFSPLLWWTNFLNSKQYWI